MRRRSIRLYAVGLSILVLLSAMVLRVVVSSRDEWQQAQALDTSGHAEAAIVHYRRAVRWYAPGLSYPGRALDALWRIGQRYEAQNDVHGALAAYRAMRAGIMSTRSFYTPHTSALRRANRRIAILMATFAPIPQDAMKPRQELEDEYLKQLSKAQRPNVLWTVILMLGFAAWTVGVIMFFERAFDSDNRVIPRVAKTWGTTVIVGMVLFVIGAALA